MKKKIWLGVLWGLSCCAQEREPDFFNERTTVVGVEENVVLQGSPAVEMNTPKTFNEKKEEKGILVDGENSVFPPQPIVQGTPQYGRSAWGGGSSLNLDAIGWSIPATFMNATLPQKMMARSFPDPRVFP